MLEWLLNLDGSILLWIQENIRHPVLNLLVIGITTRGNVGIIWILITTGLLICSKTRKTGLICAVALLGSLLNNNMILKNLVARTRPYEVLEDLKALIPPPVDTSFPSGHTGSSFACAWVLYRRLPKKYGIPAVILATCIALSRLYVGVHYPSDVLCGLISGILISCLAEYCVEKSCVFYG
ncbi:MAG: phosphatase PAP2 family protein [Lachnospiraceae bacterium]